MQSRRDQVEAQTYLLSRLTGALVSAEPDAPEPPTRRDSRGVVGGAMMALLVLGVVALFALFFAKGSTAWRQPGTLILDKSNGSRYLLRDGKLRPVQNLASAKLLVGASLKTSSVKTAALKDVPRGEPIGIPGAPDSLPQSRLLNSGVWRVCATTAQTSLTRFPRVRLVTDIGSAPSPARLGAGEGLVVVAAGQTYLVWQGQALRLARPWVADVLGWGGVSPLPVTPTWLALLTPGPDLAPIEVPERGRPGPQIDGQATKIGQLFHVDAAGVQSPYYLLQTTGLSPLTTTEYLLASADAPEAGATSLSAGALADATMATGNGDTRGLPITPPAAVRAQVGLTPCLEYPGRMHSDQPDVVWSPLPPAAAPPGGMGVGTSTETALWTTGADRAVRVRPGAGVLIRLPQASGGDNDSLLLVNDAGTVFPLAGKEEVTALGYAPERAVAVPGRFVQLLSGGTLLSVTAAQ